MNNQHQFENPAFKEFDMEIRELQSALISATNDLANPLGELVRAQIRQSQPPICGMVVLAISKRSNTAPGDQAYHHKRILLAAALEMLHVALNVHRLLVNAALLEQQNSAQGESANLLDRAFIGSTILAGDYCFSRAAQLAAQSDHPGVVATFSLALQTVSEELLREQFEAGRSAYDETRHLLPSGAQAAALLAGLPENEQQEAVTLSQEFAANWALYRQGAATGWQPSGSHSGTYPEAWQMLYRWLQHYRANGDLAAFRN